MIGNLMKETTDIDFDGTIRSNPTSWEDKTVCAWKGAILC